MPAFYSSLFRSPASALPPSRPLSAPSIDHIPCQPSPTSWLPWPACPAVPPRITLLRRLFRRSTLQSFFRAKAPGTSLSTGAMIGDSWHTRSQIFQRSMQLEIRVFSPAIKSAPSVGGSPGRTLPVFGDHDEVHGIVLLDPRYCLLPGRITVAVSTG